MIDRAASLRGRSRTGFVREAAVRAAETALMEQALVQMRADGLAAVIAPAAPVPLPAPAPRRCIAGAELIGGRWCGGVCPRR